MDIDDKGPGPIKITVRDAADATALCAWLRRDVEGELVFTIASATINPAERSVTMGGAIVTTFDRHHRLMVAFGIELGLQWGQQWASAEAVERALAFRKEMERCDAELARQGHTGWQRPAPKTEP